MQSEALVIDYYSKNSYHEVINLCYLVMISSLYKKVTYIGEKKSCENLQKLLTLCNQDCTNIIFREFNKQPQLKTKWGSVNYLFKILLVSVRNYIAYLKAPRNTDVFYNNNLFGATILVHFFSFWKHNQIFSLCHNDMEWIVWKEAKTIPMKMISLQLKLAFNIIKLKKKIHFILLSSEMADYFKTLIKQKNHDQIEWIDHSYIRPKVLEKKIIAAIDGKINVGLPGAITPNRGLDLLKQILKKISNSDLHLYSISFISEPVAANQFTMLNDSGKLLDFTDYNNNIQSMDWLLFLYDKNSYRLTASGAILEAIWNGKPIIALKNAYFEYLFNKFGEMGYLCNSEDDLIQKINSLSSDTPIDAFKKNLENCRKALLPNQVKMQLLDIIQDKK